MKILQFCEKNKISISNRKRVSTLLPKTYLNGRALMYIYRVVSQKKKREKHCF